MTQLHETTRAVVKWVTDRASSSQKHIFTYLAVRGRTYETLVKGVLHLNAAKSFEVSANFQCGNIIAGHVEIAHANLPNFCRDVMSGAFEVDGWHMVLDESAGMAAVHEVMFAADERSNMPQSNRHDRCKIKGRSSRFRCDEELDWQLKSGNPPYDTFKELASFYSLGEISDTCDVDIIALQVVAIDDRSHIRDGKAHVTVRLLKNLDSDQVSVGYRVVHSYAARRRGVVEHSEMTWMDDEDYQRGTFDIDLDAGEVVQCYARYAGRTQQQWWVFDESNSQNPRRAALEISDPELKLLKAWLRGGGKKKQADFENAIAILGWLLGFATHFVDRRAGQTTDAADILMMADFGAILVECTLEPFGPEKVSKLMRRADTVKKAFAASGYPALQICRAVVVSAEVPEGPGRRSAHEHGVLVISGWSEIEGWVNRTMHAPNANVIFSEAMARSQVVRVPA